MLFSTKQPDAWHICASGVNVILNFTFRTRLAVHSGCGRGVHRGVPLCSFSSQFFEEYQRIA